MTAKTALELSVTDRRAIAMCLHRNIPFALTVRPGGIPRFFASLPSDDECRNEWMSSDKSWNGFIINFFANDEDYVAGVRDAFDADGIIAHVQEHNDRFPPSLIETPCSVSTERLKYLSVATSIVARLKRDGGKTVLSRVIIDRSDRDLVDVALSYFSLFPGTFRYLCFTQETGIWLGATPETEADYTLSTGLLRTMALAGTMSADEKQWSVKNIEEHAFVTSYICSCLEDLGANEISCGEQRDVCFGVIKHLCTPIKAKLRGADPRKMLYALSPTPALAGSPRERAISEIFLCETHNRLCYGGFVGLKEGTKLQTWANLRCAAVYGDTYYIYAGGGLTSRSIPKDEWDEGEAKAAKLRQAIKG